MKFLFGLFFVLVTLSGDDGFLSNEEYAKKLYHNPRGISCAQCHGERGEGSVLSAYVIELDGKRKLRDIKAPAINNIKMLQFLKAFEKKRSYMPTYYLTDKELAYIYFYITKFGIKKVEKKDDKSKKQELTKEINTTVETNSTIETNSTKIVKKIVKDSNITKDTKENNETKK